MFATIAFLTARSIAPGRSEIELDVYVLFLGALALPTMISLLGEIAPREKGSRLAAALAPRETEAPPIPELERLERELRMGATRDYDLHYRLRPVVREIANARLGLRGLSLDSESGAVRELLGDELWGLARPDREPPHDRQAPGPGFDRLRQTVESLERL